jgi:DNA-binding PucR family transcriptional regulator
VCCWIGDTGYALFPDVSAATTGRVVDLVADACERMSTVLDIEVVAGLSDPRAGLTAAAECRAEADRVLRAVRARPAGGRVGTVADTRVTHALLALGDVVRDRPDLRLPGVQELVAHDRERGKAYLGTLRAYLDASGSIPEAAAALGVHVNTMRYRLERIQEISGLNLKDPQERLVLAVELLVRDLEK